MTASTKHGVRMAVAGIACVSSLLVGLPDVATAQQPEPAGRGSSTMWRAIKRQEVEAQRPTSLAVRHWERGKEALEAPAIAAGQGGTSSSGARPGPVPTTAGPITAPSPSKGAVASTPAIAPPTPRKARIGKVRVEGNRHYDTAFIERYFAPALKKGEVDLEVFQHQLLILNDMPDLKVQAFLQPSKQAGVYDVVLKAKDGGGFAGAVEYDNYGNPAVGRDRVGLTLTKGNLTGHGDTLGVRLLSPITARDATPFVQAQYTTPINADGATVGVLYASGGFVASNQVTVFDVRGTTAMYGMFGTVLLGQSLTAKSVLAFGYNSKSTSNSVAGLQSSRDEVRELVTTYSSTWKTPNTTSSLSLSMTNGLGSLFGGTQSGDRLASRRGASNSFTRINGDYATLIDMGYPYLLLRGSGQWASSPLLVTEQYPVGGADSVRGYQQAEYLGDGGYAVSAEMRLPIGSKRSDVQGAIFVDHGNAYLKNPLPGERSSVSLTGVGLGLRARLFGRAYGSVDVGFPLESAGVPSRSGAIIYGQIRTQF